jgi:hypothetical protein
MPFTNLADLIRQRQQTIGQVQPGSQGGSADPNSIYNSPRAVIDWAWGKYGSPGLTIKPPIVRQMEAEIQKQFGTSGFGIGGQIGPELARRLNEYVSGGRNNVNAGQVGGIPAPMQRTEMNPDVSPYSDAMQGRMANYNQQNPKSQVGADPMGQMRMLDMMRNEGQQQVDPNAGLLQILKALIQGG